jgi:hypothetical protein
LTCVHLLGGPRGFTVVHNNLSNVVLKQQLHSQKFVEVHQRKKLKVGYHQLVSSHPDYLAESPLDFSCSRLRRESVHYSVVRPLSS